MQYLVSVIDDKAIPAPRTRSLPSTRSTNDSTPRATGFSRADSRTPSAATVIDNRGEQAVFTDGPFVESKEYLAGFWVMEAPDLDVALKLATEASKICNRKIEVRPFL